MISFLKGKKWVIVLVFILIIQNIIGCSNTLEDAQKMDESYLVLEEQAVNRLPQEVQWRTGDRLSDNTVYYKTFYDNFSGGFIMGISYPEINLEEKLEDYFVDDGKIFGGPIQKIIQMFFDNRTIEGDDIELKNLFYTQG